MILNVPFIRLACGSHTYLYVPFLSLIVNVFVPVAGTLVFTFTPRRLRLVRQAKRAEEPLPPSDQGRFVLVRSRELFDLACYLTNSFRAPDPL